jgi:hypothetical protein
LCCPGAVGVGGDAGRVNAAGAVLDDDQGVEAPQQHGIHVDEIGREDAAGLRGQELLPGRARAARCGVDSGVMEYLPHGGGGNMVAEFDEFALHAPVPVPCQNSDPGSELVLSAVIMLPSGTR